MNESYVPPKTIRETSTTSFGRPVSGLRVVGVLTPTYFSSCDSQIRIEGNEFVVGRGKRSDGIDFQINDENVSRRHAKFFRSGNQFFIEDLKSSNGTFVDGIPVVASPLHDGDVVQIGRSSFYFDHVCEFAHPQPPPLHVPQRMDSVVESSTAGSNSMEVRFWGTRGSIPTPGAKTSKYGGNTTCLEIRFGGTILVVDAGSGIRELSNAWKNEFAANPLQVSLVFTHLHWDHIQGFPFFATGYQEGNLIDVYGADCEAGSTEELLSGQMRGAYFPIPLSAMQAGLKFHQTQREFSIGNISIETLPLPHPGGSLGYRFNAGKSSFVLATDCELDQVALNKDELQRDHLTRRQFDESMISWMKDADLLVIDCQYTDLEYGQKAGWGHNSIAAVVDVCEQVRPKMLGLFHHDPMSTDDMITDRVNETAERIADRGMNDTLVFGAREQLSLAVQPPKKPIKLG